MKLREYPAVIPVVGRSRKFDRETQCVADSPAGSALAWLRRPARLADGQHAIPS
jgi:hypothetical protein